VNTRTLDMEVVVYIFIIYNIINNLIATPFFIFILYYNKYTLHLLVEINNLALSSIVEFLADMQS
jgi:hypothetical protein